MIEADDLRRRHLLGIAIRYVAECQQRGSKAGSVGKPITPVVAKSAIVKSVIASHSAMLYIASMSVNQEPTIAVSYRLDRRLVKRMKRATARKRRRWPPPPTQTDIVARGIEMVLKKLENAQPRKNR